MKKKKGLILLLLGFSCLLALHGLQGPFAQAPTEVETLTIDSLPYVSLSQVAESFQIPFFWEEKSRKLVLRHEGRIANFMAGSPTALLGKSLFRMPGPAQIKHGDFFIPQQGLDKVMGYLLNRPLELAELPFGSSSPSSEATASGTVNDIAYYTYPLYTRLVVELSTPLHYRIKRGDYSLLLIIEGCTLADHIKDMMVGDDVIEGIKSTQKSHHTEIALQLAQRTPDYKVFYLPDAHKVVIEVRKKPSPLGRNSLIDPASSSLGEGVEPGVLFDRRLATVVLDPGHGGEDAGAKGPDGLKEKEVTLALAKTLKEILLDKLSIGVVLTRQADYYVSSEERAEAANKAREGQPADLFISLHANYSFSPMASGFEVYCLPPLPTAEPSLEMTEQNQPWREATLSPLEPVSLSPGLTMLSERNSNFRRESSVLAELIFKHLEMSLGSGKGNIHKVSCPVLQRVATPSVLVEVAFLSNPIEEAQLKDSSFRRKVAEALSQAVDDFRIRFYREASDFADS